LDGYSIAVGGVPALMDVKRRRFEKIAEGIETAAQRDFLANLGCHGYQGYLISRPLPIQELEEFAAQAY
jgi:EAL domain-containing protein (putative c-di-GMP-specific phosphodiesterase class I)